MQKICPKCAGIFECNSQEINQCACSKISIPKEVYEAINKKYPDCLCPQCLTKYQQKVNINLKK